ncbi:MAG: restriction endonuclease subunit S, partial [Bacillus sp. (in: Bacteria)]|nr:restriction endonuclease subunit S [Bacillus sp. (in: firmicutes)]
MALTKGSSPEIRFAGFSDPWEQRKLNEVTSVAPFKPYLKEARGNGKYEVIQQGDNPVLGYADGEPFGDYEKITLFGDHTLSLYKPKSPFFVATDGLKILYSEGMEGDFYYYLLEKNKPVSEGYKRHFSILKECECCFPKDKGEQRKIGEFFRVLDETISLHQRELDILKISKKSMLDKMFPKPGCDAPEIRFAGFIDSWEQRKLGELYESACSGGTPTSSVERYYDGAIPFLGIADINGRIINDTKKHISEEGLNNSTAVMIPSGTISLAMYASVGKVGITGVSMATSQAFYNMTFSSIPTRDFVYTLLEKMESFSEWEPLISTGTQRNLNADKVKNLVIRVPSEEER